MNIRSNPDTTLPAVTTGPLPSSRKIFAAPEAAPDLRVPLREIMLSEGAGEPNLPVYDTSGPYTDPDVTIDVNAGLARPRIEWVKERGGVEEYEGRAIKPIDNGNVTGKHLARAFANTPKPMRALELLLATEIFALGDIDHLLGDDPGAGEFELGDLVAVEAAQRLVMRGEGLCRMCRADIAVVLGLDAAAFIFLDAAALPHPGEPVA